MSNLTPQQIVDALNQHIIGQQAAKRAVAVALRNRWRRQQLPPETAKEISPKNIIMVGPTGVGKTEIARRLAKLSDAPFIKVEASKFTEVGYHGRDVESMVRDLVENAINLIRKEKAEQVEPKAREAAEDRLLDLILPGNPASSAGYVATEDSQEQQQSTRDRLRERLAAGAFDERMVELSVSQKSPSLFGSMGPDQIDPSMASMLEKMIPQQSKRQKLSVSEARRVLIEEETEKLLDDDAITREAIERSEQSGIIFLDEIDKIAAPSSGERGPDVSRQGVQRDLLPIVEGSSVNTKHGLVNTDHILFIAAGAFHVASVSDLMPELQGRFPIRVELSALTEDDFVRILTEPKYSLTNQQVQLLSIEGVSVTFEPSAIQAIAEAAATANQTLENIGARRLITIIEQVFDGLHFDAPGLAADGQTSVTIDKVYVETRVKAIVDDASLSKFVL